LLAVFPEPLPLLSLTLRARATDLAGCTQPEMAEWNRLGYGNNAIQRVEVRIR
jgi:hypothetical protein